MPYRILVAAFALLLAAVAATAQEEEDLVTFHGCPPQGSAKQVDNKSLNAQKNRFDSPGARTRYFRVSLAEVVRRGADSKRFAAGVPAEMVGWVRLVKDGSGETCNCGETRDKSLMDTHIELVPGPGAKQNIVARIVVVEVTSRLRQVMLEEGKDWSTKTLKATIEGRWVRVRGWLLYDHEHTESANATAKRGAGIFKGGNWEVHPITDIKLIPEPSPAADTLTTLRATESSPDASAVPLDEDAVELDPFDKPQPAATPRRKPVP